MYIARKTSCGIREAIINDRRNLKTQNFSLFNRRSLTFIAYLLVFDLYTAFVYNHSPRNFNLTLLNLYSVIEH